MTLILQRHCIHWRVPSSRGSRPCLQETQVSSVKTIPARRTRSHPPKWTIEAEDPDLLIPLELSWSRANSDLSQDLGGDLSVVSPRESHQSEETLPTVPLGQFQAQRSDNTTTKKHCSFPHRNTLPKWNKQYNNRKYCNFPRPIHPPKEKYSQRQGLVPAPVRMWLTVMETHLRNIYTKREANPTQEDQWEQRIRQHPPKVKYFLVTITVQITILIAKLQQPPKVK